MPRARECIGERATSDARARFIVKLKRFIRCFVARKRKRRREKREREGVKGIWSLAWYIDDCIMVAAFLRKVDVRCGKR